MEWLALSPQTKPSDPASTASFPTTISTEVAPGRNSSDKISEPIDTIITEPEGALSLSKEGSTAGRRRICEIAMVVRAVPNGANPRHTLTTLP